MRIKRECSQWRFFKLCRIEYIFFVWILGEMGIGLRDMRRIYKRCGRIKTAHKAGFEIILAKFKCCDSMRDHRKCGAKIVAEFFWAQKWCLRAIFLGDCGDFCIISADDDMIKDFRFYGVLDRIRNDWLATELLDIFVRDTFATAAGWDYADIH